MSFSTGDIGFEGLDALAGIDSLCLFVAEDGRPLPGVAGYVDWRLCGALSRVLQNGFFTGQRADTLLFPSERKVPVDRIFAVGVGKTAQLDAAALREVLQVAAAMLNKAKVQGVGMELPAGPGLSDEERAAALRQTFVPAFSGQRVTVLSDRGVTKLLAGKAGG